MIGNKIEFEYYNNGEQDLFLCHYNTKDNTFVFTFNKNKEQLEAMSETFKSFVKETIFSKIKNSLNQKIEDNEKY